MLVYFIEEEFLDEIFDKVDKFNSDKYYAKMAVAWLLSMCYVKYPQKTEKFFSVTNLDKDTFNKSIQKILDSQKISKKDKVYIKTLKR
jgi:3-methyladenine DNA glycosylase AlkD